jgi:Ca2+-binding EF-hand superfamily protein
MGAATSDLVLRPEEVEELHQISGFSTAEVRRMYLRFIKLDSRKVGTVSKEDVMRIPELAMNPLVDRIMHVLGLENRSRLNFTEFLQSLAPFSRSAPKELKLKGMQVFDGRSRHRYQ